MREPEPILVAHLFEPVNDALVALLRSLTPQEWDAPTVAGAWSVKDVAVHLLDTTIRRLSMDRDGYAPPLPADAFADGLAGFVNSMNRDGVAWGQRLSSPLLIDLHERYGRQMAAFFASLHPHQEARWSVSWAGERRSPVWFDTARELTERWHHQQQIRDAIGRPPLFEYLAPVLATFVRALPFTYREVAAPPGTALVFRVTDEGEGTWSLVRRDGGWQLYEGEAASPAVTVSMRGDDAWRIFTRQRIDPDARIEGDRALSAPLLKMVAVV